MIYSKGLLGIRAWLSWIIVFSHIIHMTGIYHIYPILKGMMFIGDANVNIFIMISGFVITSVILEKKETYRTFIARRILRIYPAYLICLFMGIFASELYADAMLSRPWGEQTPPLDRLIQSMNSLKENGYLYHIIAHITLLHGLIPNDILYDSQYMFLAPAWSLSLELQFYIIAPLLVAFIQKPNGAIYAALGALIGLTIYQIGGFGFFRLPSILPGAAIFFAVGIGARFIIPKLPKLNTYPVAFILIALGCSAYGYKTAPFLAFIILMIYILVDNPKDKLGQIIDKIMNVALMSKSAKYLGNLSYSTFLIHEPILQLFIYLLVTHATLSITHTAIILFITLPIATFIGSVLLNKSVEQPFINLGRKLFSQKS